MKKVSLTQSVLLFCAGLVWGISVFFLFSQSVRLDEAQSLWVATRSVPGILGFVARDVHVPLYPVLLHFWLQIFGNTIITARALSLLFFALTLPGLYILGRESGDRRIGILLIALFSFSPFIMWFGSETRMYSLFTLIVTFHHVFFLRVVNSGGQTSKLALFLTTVAGFYTHYFFMLLIASQWLYLFLLTIQNRYKEAEDEDFTPTEPKHEKRVLFSYSKLIAAAFLFFAPWVFYVVSLGAASQTKPSIPPPTTFNIFQSFVVFLVGFQQDSVQTLLVSLWPLSLLVLFLIFTRKKDTQLPPRMGYFFLATFLPVALAYAASFVRPLFLTRYLILVTPTLFFIVAWLLSSMTTSVSLRVVRVMFAALLVLLLYQNVSLETPVREDYKKVVSYVEKKVTPYDVVAVSAPFTVYPIEYLYHGSARIVTIPSWNRYTEGSIPALQYDKLYQQVEEFKKRYKRIYVILSHNQGEEKNIVGYLNKNLTLVEVRKYSPGLRLLVYEPQ